MSKEKIHKFAVRTLSGLFLAAVVIGAALWSPVSYGVLLLVIAAGSLWEFYRLCERTGSSPQKFLGMAIGIGTLLFYFTLVLCGGGDITLPPTLLMALAPLVCIVELYRKSGHPIRNIAVTVMGTVYVAYPLALLFTLPLVFGPASYAPELFLWFIFMVWGNDVFAYLVGVTCGRHRLFERISPNKSWEGFFGGVAGAVGIGLLAGHLLSQSLWLWGCMGLVVAVTGVLGDLVESMFKRSAGLKDSGNILPGHGGFLDRFDALLLSTPFVFFLYALVV